MTDIASPTSAAAAAAPQPPAPTVITPLLLESALKTIFSLPDFDPNVATKKSIRQMVADHLKMDLSEHTDQLNQLIEETHSQYTSHAVADGTEGGEPAQEQVNGGGDQPADDQPLTNQGQGTEEAVAGAPSGEEGAAVAAEGGEEEGAASASPGKRGRKAAKPKKERKASPAKAKGTNAFGKLYYLPPSLAAVLGKTEMSRSDVTKGIWAYCREKSLAKEKGKTVLDETLAAALGRKTLTFTGLSKTLKGLLKKDYLVEAGEPSSKRSKGESGEAEEAGGEGEGEEEAGAAGEEEEEHKEPDGGADE